MMLTILIGSVAVVVVAVTVMSSRAYAVADPVLAGETTAVGLADPGIDTMATHNGTNSSLKADWNLTTVSALCDAEEMLDYLEMQGCSERELIVLGNSCFTIRWR